MNGQKHDQAKPRFSLLPSAPLWQVVEVLEFGAGKYSRIEPISVVDFGKLVESELCQKYKNVCNVDKISVSLRKGYAPVVTEKTQVIMPTAQNAANLGTLHLKIDCADPAMSENDLAIELTKNLESMSIKSGIVHNLNLDKKKKSESKEDGKTHSMWHKLKEMDFYGVWQNMDYRSKNILVLWSGAAPCVNQKNDHTLITTIKLEDLEICFVVSATKLLDCYKMTLKLLVICLNISISTKQIERHISGVDNWRNVPNARERYFNACHRHLNAWWAGEMVDNESGLPHLAHAVCCLLFLMWFDKKGG